MQGRTQAKAEPLSVRQMVLVKKFRPLAIKLAHRAWLEHTALRVGNERDDFEQHAMLGLIDAARLYNPQHASGAKHITYFHRAIALRLLRVTEHSRVIHIPQHVGMALHTEREPSKTTKAIRPDYLEAGYRALCIGNLSLARHEAGYECFAPEEEDAGGRLDATAVTRRLLKRLPWVERRVLVMLFLQRMTLESVGLELNLTRERVRQIKVKALARCRAAAEGVTV